MRLVVAYDIANNKRRRRIDKWLSGFGLRHQESVFEFDLPPVKVLKLRRGIQKRINVEFDKVRVFPLCSKDALDIRYCGCSECSAPMDTVII